MSGFLGHLSKAKLFLPLIALLSASASWSQSQFKGCGYFCSELFWQAVEPDLMKEYLLRTPDATTATASSGHYALHFAAMHGRKPETLRSFLRAGAKTDVEDKEGTPPLLYAILYNDNPAITRVFLEEGADVHFVRPDGTEILLYAILAQASAAIVEVLAEAGAKADVIYGNQLTTLHYSILQKSKPDVVKVIAKKAKLDGVVDARDVNNMTAFYLAVDQGAGVEVAQALLEGGADPCVGNDLDVTPLDIAQVKDPEVAKLIEEFLKETGREC